MSKRSLSRLKRLVTIRKRQEEVSRNVLAQSLRKASEISDELRDRTEALESVINHRSPTSRRAAEPIVDASEIAINAARAAEASAFGTVEELRRDWETTAKRLRSAERLEDYAEEAERLEQISSERIAVDEAISGRLPKGDSE